VAGGQPAFNGFPCWRGARQDRYLPPPLHTPATGWRSSNGIVSCGPALAAIIAFRAASHRADQALYVGVFPFVHLEPNRHGRALASALRNETDPAWWANDDALLVVNTVFFLSTARWLLASCSPSSSP